MNMKGNITCRCARWAGLFVWFLYGTAITQAAPQVANVPVETSLEAGRALGLLISPSGTRQVTGVEVVKAEEGGVIVSVPYDDTQIAPGTMVSAMVVDDSGAFAFGAVRELSSSGSTAPEILPCPEEPVTLELAHALTSIQKLVEVRNKLVEVGKQRTVHLLQGDFLNKLRKLEKGFGLVQEPELSPDLDPFLLVDRLERILNVLKTYSFFKPAEPEE